MNSILKKILSLVLTVVCILLVVIVYRAYVINQPCKHKLKKIDDSNKYILTNETLRRLQNALTYQTVSFDQSNQNETALLAYLQYIRKEFNDLEQYPFVKFNIINNYSMLYQITGSQPDLKPYLLVAHTDVVPTNAESDRWLFDPFAGKISEGFIYGRGTLDDKGCMLAQLEAVRMFIRKNGRPRRSIYLAYGHDEEISGKNGAKKIAEFLGNVTFEYALDEGTMVIEDLFKGLDRPIALIGIADKGYLSVKFYVNTTGGHSSVPNDDSSPIYILNEALHKLRHNKQPSFLGYGPEKDMFEKSAAHMGFIERVILSNLWLFKRIVAKIFAKTNLDTLQRTSTSPTMFHSGVKDNVVPAYAEFVINHRIHSLQTCEDVLKQDLKIMNDDRINHQVISCTEPTHISPIDSLGYKLIEHTTLQIFPESIPIPGLMIALTDSRFYANQTRNIYKFMPVKLRQADVKRYHGIDERISLKNYEDMINFFYILVENSDNAHLELDFYEHTEL